MADGVKWVGHASAVIELAGETVLIDPLGRKRCSGVRDYHTVLITHAHVVTMNARREIIEDGAVIIRGSRIIAVGPAALAAQFTALKTIDARGNHRHPARHDPECAVSQRAVGGGGRSVALVPVRSCKHQLQF